MKNLFTKTLLLGGLAGSLVFGGCGNKNNKKYQDFANFVKDNGKFEDYYMCKKFGLTFSANNKEYFLNYNPRWNIFGIFAKSGLNILVVDNDCTSYIDSLCSFESFHDDGLNGLDYYYYHTFRGDKNIKDSLLSQKDKDRYNSLIDRIPKWYVESKKIK